MSRILTVSQNPSGTDSFSNLSDALNAAQPGNIIEIADSGTYPAALTISTNAEGLPLHGITIRASASQTQILDGNPHTGVLSAIQVVSLRNVLIQGLTIRGGLIGILLSHPSTSLPLSVTID